MTSNPVQILKFIRSAERPWTVTQKGRFHYLVYKGNLSFHLYVSTHSCCFTLPAPTPKNPHYSVQVPPISYLNGSENTLLCPNSCIKTYVIASPTGNCQSIDHSRYLLHISQKVPKPPALFESIFSGWCQFSHPPHTPSPLLHISGRTNVISI